MTAMIGQAQRFFFRNIRVEDSDLLKDARTRDVCTLSAEEEREADVLQFEGNFIWRFHGNSGQFHECISEPHCSLNCFHGNHHWCQI